MAADKAKEAKKSKEVKIKVDSGANIPSLAFFVVLGSLILFLIAILTAMVGFLFIPPLTSVAAAFLTALVAVIFYRLFLYASATRSVLAARISVGISAVLVSYVHICMVMSILERMGGGALLREDILAGASDLLSSMFSDYFLRPTDLFESYLYYGGGWVVTMLLAPGALLFFSQTATTGGVAKRQHTSLHSILEDSEDEPSEKQNPKSDGGKQKKTTEDKKGAKEQ